MGFVALSADGERVERFVALPLSPLQWARAPGFGGGGGVGLRDVDHFAALRRASAAAAAPDALAPDALADDYQPRGSDEDGGEAPPPAMVHVAAAVARVLEQASQSPPWRAALVFG